MADETTKNASKSKNGIKNRVHRIHSYSSVQRESQHIHMKEEKKNTKNNFIDQSECPTQCEC